MKYAEHGYFQKKFKLMIKRGRRDLFNIYSKLQLLNSVNHFFQISFH